MTKLAYLAVYRMLDDGQEHAANMRRSLEYCAAIERARQWRAFTPWLLRDALADLGECP